MNLPTIEMKQDEARQAFRDYRQAVRSAKTSVVNSEDAQIARAYKALAEGKKIVNLDEAFAQAGYDDVGRPRLAVSRADHQQIVLGQRHNWITGRDVLDFEMGPAHLIGNWRQSEGQVFRVPSGPILPPRITMYAIVPNIPPALRPPHALVNYHLLWEPRWLLRPRPPGDPALLKWLGGPLYAVLATWELTPVEQAVLGITRA